MLRVWCSILLVFPIAAIVAQPLSTEECQKLYAKQLLMATEAGPLSRALKINQSGLVAQSTVLAEVQSCQVSVSRKLYACQMAASSFLEILLCEETVKNGKNLNSLMDSFRKKQAQSDDLTGPGNEAEPTEGDPAEPGQQRASAEQCKTAYEKMLRIYSGSDYLKNDPDRKSLLASWDSESARISFQSRCVQRFSASDASCLRDSTTVTDVQTCLAAIPPG
ncbi:MAG: hypothetical protein KDK23_03635 [Leptospiraceae bacterium]|nr:hypothetical protein [Leptospiraceae bacterium]